MSASLLALSRTAAIVLSPSAAATPGRGGNPEEERNIEVELHKTYVLSSICLLFRKAISIQVSIIYYLMYFRIQHNYTEAKATKPC